MCSDLKSTITVLYQNHILGQAWTLADPRRAYPARPHLCIHPGSQIFYFVTHIFLNVARSGVGAPPYEVGTPSYVKSWIYHCLTMLDTVRAESQFETVTTSIRLNCTRHFKLAMLAKSSVFIQELTQISRFSCKAAILPCPPRNA